MGRLQDRKLYVAALALALGGLVLDKAVLRGGLSPQAAEAADSLLVDASEPVGAPSTPPSENSAEVAERLEQAKERLGLDPLNVTDAFSAPGLVKAVTPVQIDLAPEEAFRARCRLHAVVVERLEGGAQVGGAALVETKDDKKGSRSWRWDVGRTVDGWTLVSVDARTATFKSDDYTVVLSLPDPLKPVETAQSDSVNRR